MYVTDELYQKLNGLFVALGKKFIAIHGRYYGDRFTAEDFAQECWLKVLELHDDKDTVKRAVNHAKRTAIKFISRSQKIELKEELTKAYERDEDGIIRQITAIANSILDKNELEAYYLIKANKIRNKSKRYKQNVGFSYKEIAYLTGLSESRITRMLNKIRREIIAKEEINTKTT